MIENLTNIFNSCYPQFRMSPDRFKSLILGENTHIFTHKEQGGIIAFATTENSALRFICVSPDHQRQGIGTRLLKQAETHLKTKGFTTIYTGGVTSNFLIGADQQSADFFVKHGFSTVGKCDEMLLQLRDYTFNKSLFRGHKTAEYGWYNGEISTLHKAVAEVDESWVQYFTEDAKVYAATVKGEIASFCLVSTDVSNYLTDAYGRVGMPGCVGTVPKHRNKGIAIEMIARVTQYLKESGMDISFIYFTGVADWYKKLDYQVFLTEIFMQKQLT